MRKDVHTSTAAVALSQRGEGGVPSLKFPLSFVFKLSDDFRGLL